MRKAFILDTNVLLFDPQALFKFGNNDIIIPIVVVEEIGSQGPAILLITGLRPNFGNRCGTQHLTGFALKAVAVVDRMEAEVAGLAAAPFSVAHIATGCALTWLDFRFPNIGWRETRPALAAWHETFAARPSVQAYPPIDD